MMRQLRLARAAVYALLAACLLSVGCVDSGSSSSSEGGDDNWLQWRGPGGLGLSSATGLPIDWSQNILWKQPVEGTGNSSPIIWEDKIFLTTAVQQQRVPGAAAPIHYYDGEQWLHPSSAGAEYAHTLKVLSLSARTGRLLWEQTAYEGTVYDNRLPIASYASPTAVTDGELLYVYFGSQGVYAYELDGKPVWNVHLGDRAKWGLGNGTSPVLYEDLLILQCDEDEGDDSFIVALDKKTGDEVWRVDREVEASWGTPVLVESNNHTELITNGNELFVSYDPATGDELWRMDGLLGATVVQTPVVGHGMVFMMAGFPDKITKAIALGGTTDAVATPSLAWQYNKGTGYVPSNLVYGDYLYLMSDGGILTCLDPKTGAIVYEGGRVPIPGRFAASLIGFDDKILQISEDGDAFIIKAGPEHEVLATNSLGEPVMASPSIADGRLFIRGREHLYAIGASSS